MKIVNVTTGEIIKGILVSIQGTFYLFEYGIPYHIVFRDLTEITHTFTEGDDDFFDEFDLTDISFQ